MATYAKYNHVCTTTFFKDEHFAVWNIFRSFAANFNKPIKTLIKQRNE